VQPHDALGRPQPAGHRRHGQGRRVRRQQGRLGKHVLEAGEQLLLGGQLLGDGLDRERAAGQVGQVGRGLQAGGRRRRVVGVQHTLGREPLQPAGQPLDSGRGRARPHVEHPHRMAGLGGDQGDPGTHRAGAHHGHRRTCGDGRDRLVGHR
jgi:hypothetical protein